MHTRLDVYINMRYICYWYMKPRPRRPLSSSLLIAAILAVTLPAQPKKPAPLPRPQILTAQYNNARTNANLAETILTPRNVNAKQFGKLFVLPVDGDVTAQPLYVPNLPIPGQGIHDVLFVITAHDSIYAFDAANKPPQPLWHTALTNEQAGIHPVPSSAVQCSFLGPEVGITSTPVIDPATRTMYFVARTARRSPNGEDLYYQHLHAVDITTGDEKPGSPVLLRASAPGSSFFGLLHGEVTFNAVLENQRAALLLSQGTVFIAWGSSCDEGNYFGWVMGYDARTLRQSAAWNTAPDSGESAIWQSGAGLAADPEGNIYAATGNGKFTASSSNGHDFGDSLVKLFLRNNTLSVRDYFTPSNEAAMNRGDNDLGSTGPVLLPDQPGPHPHMALAAGKDGKVYLIDRDHMGKYQPGSDPHAVQAFQLNGGAYGAPAYWNGHVYYCASGDFLKDFALNAGKFSAVPVHASGIRFKNPGAFPAISANGNTDGIVWLVVTKEYWQHDIDADLQAWDAADVSHLLYETGTGAPGPGVALRFTIPTIANGRVYIASRGAVHVYGLMN